MENVNPIRKILIANRGEIARRIHPTTHPHQPNTPPHTHQTCTPPYRMTKGLAERSLTTVMVCLCRGTGAVEVGNVICCHAWLPA